MKFRSPAKVNLHLQVLGKRGDGYHEIQTLMLPVAIYDEVEILVGGSEFRFTAEGREIPEGRGNIIWKAAEVIFQECGQKPVQVHLTKRIPVAAGLGGGSSNAATVLMGLNGLLQAGLNQKRLMEMGAKIGADVPFFLFEKSALARGTGEKLTEVVFPPALWFLLIVPPFPLSSAWAYTTYDQLAPKNEGSIPLAEVYTEISDLLPILTNDLELAVLSKYPEIGQVKEKLIARGAKGALMSGSGSVVFGLFSTQAGARRAAEEINLPSGWETMVTHRI
ncbi:MAG: 4-(cytidine 5'-diphospho)-2-C-methyl-D-erythritol kinase [Deltaproteobacteria bacterium]|nr:4-(cytidine 5'-diphospho)-2-C-methyl-D-erythritol kinase [Deltaproteobacteria bacterium]